MFITILGTLASFIGAIISYFQAKKAKKSATIAEEMSSKIKKNFERTEKNLVYEKTQEILTKIKTIGPTAPNKSFKGRNCNEMAKEIEDYVTFVLKKYENELGQFGKKLSQELRPLIVTLSNTNDESILKETGEDIYYRLSDFLPRIKEIAKSSQFE